MTLERVLRRAAMAYARCFGVFRNTRRACVDDPTRRAVPVFSAVRPGLKREDQTKGDLLDWAIVDDIGL